MSLIIRKVHGNVIADGIQLLTGRNMIREGEVAPTEAEDGRRMSFASLLDGGRNELVQEHVGRSPNGHRSYDRQGNTYRIMRVSVAAGRHHKAFSSIIQDHCFAFFNKSFGAFFIAYIDVLPVPADILHQANKQVERTIREIREAQAERDKTRTARAALNQAREELKQDKPSANDEAIERKMKQIVERKERERARKEKRGEQAAAPAHEKPQAVDKSPLQVGDKVRLKDNGMVGEVVQVSAKYVSVSIGSIISKMAPGKIERISNQQYKEKQRSTFRPVIHYDSESISRRKLEFKPTIDIRGERLNDALDIVMHFIDDATMVGVSQVKILHGKGNGVLREEIRKFLKTVPAVASFRDEAVQQGGAGITVVEMDI